MPSIIHAALTTDVLVPVVELPPSPPQSPPKHFANLSTKHVNPLMWSPSWHAIHDAMATFREYDHQVVAFTDTPPLYIANTLDPLFQHQEATIGDISHWDEFVAYSENCADQIVARYQSDQDIVYLHDYQLVLLPGILRRKLPHAIIGLAIYSLFPNMDNLQEHRRIVQSMLAADLIGLQFTMPFLSAAHVALIPPTVHLKSVSSVAQARSRAIRQLFGGKRIVLCQDTEPAGVLQTLAAMEHYLSAYDSSIVFIHICTKASIPQSLHAVPDLVRQINQLYGSSQSVPIHFYHQDLDVDEYDALLAAADAALIMGLHPHAALATQTFIERQSNKPLIVSRGSPFDITAVDQKDTKQMAATLHDVLTNGQTFCHVPNKPFLQNLKRTMTPLLNVATLTDAYRAAPKRLFLFDYDGTLTPIVSNPDDAKPSRQLLRYLQTLCNDPQNTVWIVSGRDQATLESWLGNTVQGIGLSAEHGSFMKLPGEQWQDMLASADMSWKKTALAIFQEYTQKTPGTVVEQKKSSITWHYRNAQDAQLALEQCEACFKDLQQIQGVDILRGKMNLEVRSQLVNKGNVVKRIQDSVNANFVLCAGDDRTDEDMFHALKDQPSFCVLIGAQDKNTEAKWCIDSSEQFVTAIGKLAAISSSAL